MGYLGSLIYRDGRVDSELSCKLGIARADFHQLQTLWKHAGVTLKDKLRFFHSLVVSKLLYGFSTMSLVKQQRRRLDGFYARCLRKILRVPPAFYSRVSNQAVLSKAGVAPFSEQILFRQLVLMGKVARSSPNSPLRRDTFVDDGRSPQIGRFIRVIGRPRQDWTNHLLKEGRERLGHRKFNRMLEDRSMEVQERWVTEVRRTFASV